MDIVGRNSVLVTKGSLRVKAESCEDIGAQSGKINSNSQSTY